MNIKDFFANNLDSENVPAEWWLERYRNWREIELKNTDWTQLPDAPANSQAWANYRQVLRDLPANKNFADLELPNRPE